MNSSNNQTRVENTQNNQYTYGNLQNPNLNYVQQNNNQIYNNKQPQRKKGFLTEASLGQKNGASAEIVFKDWLKYIFATIGVCFLSLVLLFIPYIGPVFLLLPIVFQIYLLCRKTTAKSLKSFLKAQLIILACLLVLAIIFFLFVVFVVPAMSFWFVDGFLALLSLA